MKRESISALLIATFLIAGSLIVANASLAEGDVPRHRHRATIADFSLPDASGKDMRCFSGREKWLILISCRSMSGL